MRITKSQLKKVFEDNTRDYIPDATERDEVADKVVDACESFSIQNEAQWNGMRD